MSADNKATRQHNDARRVMTKALVEDLWKAWRQNAVSYDA